MPTTIKKGTEVLVVEGPNQGVRGTVTQLQRVFDADSKVMRWTVWVDGGDGYGRIKTRLSWVREV